MTDDQMMIVKEKTELDRKRIALMEFLDRKPAPDISATDRKLLETQRGIMLAYSQVLDLRIDRFRP